MMAEPLSAVDRMRYVRVDHLQAGDLVQYYGRVWTVHECMPVFFLGGHAVIAYDPRTEQRVVLLYDNPAGAAVVVLR